MSVPNFYQSPLRKLVKFFEKSRDDWKAKSLANKQENRQLKRKLRTLEIAKKKWKDEAIALRFQVKNFEKSSKTIKSDLAVSQKKTELIVFDSPLKEVHIPNHTYSATTIFLLLQLVLSAISRRFSVRALTIINDVFGKALDKVPSWFSVRIWLLRLGYYKLRRSKPIANDWCWIADHTIQLGKIKCLLILGIRVVRFLKEEVLIIKTSNPLIYFRLRDLLEKLSGNNLKIPQLKPAFHVL